MAHFDDGFWHEILVRVHLYYFPGSSGSWITGLNLLYDLYFLLACEHAHVMAITTKRIEGRVTARRLLTISG